MSGCRSLAGRLFQTFFPYTEKLRSPSSRVLVQPSKDSGVSDNAGATENAGVENAGETSMEIQNSRSLTLLSFQALD